MAPGGPEPRLSVVPRLTELPGYPMVRLAGWRRLEQGAAVGTIRRLILVRHGETDGESSIRYYGSTDVGLSPEGEAQMRQVASRLRAQRIDLVGASPLSRSWRSAWIAGRGASVQLFAGLREVDFGRWEGFTAAEIEETDPTRYAEWRSGAENFGYPGGETRADFQARVREELDRLLRSSGTTALLVLHKGVIRVIVETLTGEALGIDEPALGEAIVLSAGGDGWKLGSRSSNPDALADLDAA